MANPGPNNASITHGAGFTTRDEFEPRHIVRSKVETPQDSVSIREGHHFGVGKRTVGGLDDVDADGDESSRPGVKHRSAEGPAGPSGNVGECKLDDELHTI